MNIGVLVWIIGYQINIISLRKCQVMEKGKREQVNTGESGGREEVLIALNEKFPVMKHLFCIRKIGIFGSFARGTMRPDSDIDVEVEFEKGADSWRNFIGLAAYLEDLLGRKVDLVTKRVLDDFLTDDTDAGRMDRNRDRVYISRMAAELAFLTKRRTDTDFRAFVKDEVFKRASLRSIQVIGECATAVSHGLQQEHPDVPWAELQGLRSRFTPRYFTPDWVLVWDLIDAGIPGLEPKIRSIAAGF